MIKKININLARISGYIEGEYDRKIRGQLKKNSLYNKNYLYSIFNGNRIKQIEETGNYRKENPDSIFALTKDELVWESEFNKNSLKHLSIQYDNPTIAIYDRSQFREDYEKGRYEYFFKDPDKKLEALIAIAFLRFD